MAGPPGRDPWGTPGICYLFGFLLAGLLFPGAAAFNLDVMGALRKEGEPGSLFGFSVALHRQLQPRPQSWLLVGAPQALALPGQQANRTGGLFACPLSLEETDCYRVDIDQGADVQKESKENQWLGVSVRSQGPGGKIVTCAHRYEARQRVDQILETRDVIGRCFVLSQDLAIRDELDGGEWKFCEGRPQGHEQFGFCQQGTAAAFSPDSHYLLFGAPGTYNWKGESLPREGRREPKCPSTSERGLGAACGQACLRVHRHGALGPRHASHRVSPARTRLGPSVSCPPHGREFCSMLA